MCQVSTFERERLNSWQHLCVHFSCRHTMGTVLNIVLPYFVRYRWKKRKKTHHEKDTQYQPRLQKHIVLQPILATTGSFMLSFSQLLVLQFLLHHFLFFLKKSRLSQLLDNLKKVRTLCCHDILQRQIYTKTRLLSTINQFETLATKRCVNYNLSKWWEVFKISHHC